MYPVLELKDGGKVVIGYNTHSSLFCYSEFSLDGKRRNYDAKRYPEITEEMFRKYIYEVKELYNDKIKKENLNFGAFSG